MKKGIHPNYVESQITCSCGETFVTYSTNPKLRVEICSKCHPFYTGKQKLVDAGGRVQRFQKKYGLQTMGTPDKKPAKKTVDSNKEQAVNESSE